MKTLLSTILLFPVFSFAQNSVEVRLVDPNQGTPVYNLGWQMGNTSNDSGLNSILEAHGVFNYIGKYGHMYEPWFYSIVHIDCACPNGVQDFVADLSDYPEIVASAEISQWEHYNNAVVFHIVENGGFATDNDSDGNGLPTTDAGLNAILASFGVFQYAQAFPSSQNAYTLRYHYALCNCDETELYAALSEYSGVDAVEYMQAGYLLSNPEVDKPKTSVYPNPFQSTFSVETDAQIKSYVLFDASGRQIVFSDSKSTIDAAASNLASGFYTLQLEFGNGQKQNFKLIKN